MTVTERTHANCEACGQGYSVPDPDRTYTCKLCQGTVRVPGKGLSSEGHLIGALDCDECHAINHAGTETCVECGAPLTEKPAEESHEDSLRARRQATHELRRGYKWIDAFRWICRGGAFGYALVTLTAIVALGRPEVPLEAGLLVVSLCTLLTILMLLGAIQLLFKPFVWTLTIAIAATAASGVHFVGPNPLGLTFAWSAFWAVLFWIAVSPSLRFRKLIAAHTDLYIMQRASQRTRNRLEGDDTRHRHERLLRVMRTASQRAWRLSIAGVIGATVVSAATSFLVLSEVRPAELDSVVRDFEETWKRSSRAAALERFFDPELREWQVGRLGGLAAGHGWSGRFPDLVRVEEERSSNEAVIEYDAGNLQISMDWILREREWLLLQIRMPVPPFETAFERFLATWEQSDLTGLSKFFAPEFQERMETSLQNSLINRRWQTLPEIIDRDIDEPEDEKAVTTLNIEGGAVIASWWISRTGEWTLQSIVFPKPTKAPRKKPLSEPGSGK